MQVIVDGGRCEADAPCTAAAPAVFRPEEGGVLQVLDDTPGGERRARVEAVVRAGPMTARALDG